MPPEADKQSVSRLEQMVGIAVLVVMAAVAMAFFAVQFQFNPAVTARQALSVSTDSPPTLSLAQLAPPDVTPLSPPERFGPDTLSNKINGKAELYFSAGFQFLTAQRFALVGNSSQWFEIFVYDMGTARNAFSAFSMQRRGDVALGGPTAYSYGTSNGRFLAHGSYYVELVAADVTDSLMAAADAMASAFVARTTSEAADVAEMTLFPAEDRVAGSRSLVTSDAFGIAGFNQVFTAAYRLKDTTVTVYVARRDSDILAAAGADIVRDFYLEFGGIALPGPDGMAVIDILDTIEVVFHQGRYVLGVHEAPDAKSAIALAGRLKQRLKEIAHDGS